MKLAVIGSGISGLACAHLLKKNHEIVLFEAANKPGGHVNTVDVNGRTGDYRVDTGFIVFNEQNYPNFVRLLEKLDVQSQPTRMGFSVRSERTGIEYSGESILGLFGGFKNLTDPKHWGMVRDLLRFHRLPKKKHIQMKRWENLFPVIDLENDLLRHSYSPLVRPFGHALSIDFLRSLSSSSLISCPTTRCCRPTTGRSGGSCKGGSRTYVDKIVRGTGRAIYDLSTPVRSVRRSDNGGIPISLPDGSTQKSFDQAILACHADQSLKMLDGAEREEIELLQKFPLRDTTRSLYIPTTGYFPAALPPERAGMPIPAQGGEGSCRGHLRHEHPAKPANQRALLRITQPGIVHRSILTPRGFHLRTPYLPSRSKVRPGHAPLLYPAPGNIPLRGLLGVWIP